MDSLLSGINSPEDIKNLNNEELQSLAGEIRRFMVESVSHTGGHLAPSLGVVELILALCAEFNFPKDKIIFDVGHQSYAYKIITGRRDDFPTLRQWEGMSGFPKTEESQYDAFNTGHSSTSISAGLGMAVSRDLQGENYEIVSVIGDGALTGGMAFEALNNAGNSKKDLIVILNDNEMSISPNVGAMANYLSRVRTAPKYVNKKRSLEKILNRTKPGTFVFQGLRRIKDSLKYLVVSGGVIFEEFGFTYLGPIDGHDIPLLRQYLKNAIGLHGPVLIHVHTIKGKGYYHAEANPDVFHGVGKFDSITGKILKSNNTLNFSKSFGTHLLDMASSDQRICAITAAMPDGTGLSEFARIFPNRFFDVGIAEQHAITFAAGLAQGGSRPVVAVYSSFLQRGIDQVFHDVCLQNLPVIIALDRSGIVGEDGETHQGIYDISLLRTLPNITIMSPSTDKEVRDMLRFAKELGTPCVLRYPRGEVGNWDSQRENLPITLGSGELVANGSDILLIPLGIMMEEALKARDILENKGIKVGVFNPRFVKPLDEINLRYLCKKYKKIICIEDHVKEGGFGSSILEFCNNENINVHISSLGYPNTPIKQGNRDVILANYGLNATGIAKKAMEILEI
ncbi:MAG: 1-deoxy-D-xylulose-5-phosphate synthase [Clostridiales bacterium]